MSNKFILPKSHWNKLFRGWLIVDCVARNASTFSCLLRQDMPHDKASLMWDHDIPSRLLSVFMHHADIEKQVGWVQIEGFNKPRLGVSRTPVEQSMIAARNADGEVWPLGAGKSGPMEAILKGGHPSILKIKCINGFAYAVGQFRNVFKRTAEGKWERVGAGFPKKENSVDDGFEDIDGLSEDLMYAVGGNGDVWRCIKKKWRKCAFPGNEQLGTVTYGPDGIVYISGEGGNLWVGKEDKWKKVHEASSSVLYNDSVWFEDKLWLCSDHALHIWNGKTMERPAAKGETVVASGHMDARDGLLVVASQSHVWTYDGKQWQTVVQPYK